MISKKRRILRKDFAYILNNSKRYNTDNLLLFIAPINSTAGREESRISFSVSKKVQPLASNRNRYRRWGYDTIKETIKQIKPGYYLFFSFKKTPKPTSFLSTSKGVKELLSLSGVLS
ncbi:MAG: hypothetical protein A2566_03260 [Candidatus Zambryskibacteria bacterium RIFOXYD1_FULL_40_13]|nr:MAG: hypothetical protein UT25_C0002G0036 [Parcubacteria group bacterium GW2011_GWC1_39_12]KKR19465.1 MAG: hypothetical protein UT49_C0002G0311 [Parcubacteria group bacterium GW2011_GWF1_39_37]KKR35091.1 MAG: hypothetical protein UT68_C0005G0040 [Parcubacteria group bacterium GW2011_GWC2_40_10]KKR52414.1 MAG: hypothetical protein UT89_C0002G0215 [Parcubacteria group bacterium GW2011_GWE1_40_20]KKR69478.1 MAG: hypothetical protein UU11_C0001G0064 [Parcubacteria group bacterium GW2011_GWF2_40_